MAERRPTVAVIGAGLAGLSAASALADSGYVVTLHERRPYVGGRASSYEHPGTGEVVDNCQHVLLGCCTNLIDLYRRYGAEQRIQWFDWLTFIEPGGKRSTIRPGVLPAPFHSTVSFFTAQSLTLKDKLGISRALTAMMPGVPADDKDFLIWLKEHGQTQPAIERFWKPVIVSALNEDLDCASAKYAVQVFRESFLKSAAAGRMGIPLVPLSELYSAGIRYIEERGGKVLLRSSVEAIEPAPNSVRLRGSFGEQQADYAIVAAPFQSVGKLLPSDAAGDELRARLDKMGASPITGIHLWFDRVITDLPHAVLLERTIQWMFHKSILVERHRNEAAGSYVELVVSASKSLVEKSRQEIIDLALAELAEFFPAVREAKLVKAAVIKEVYATYSIAPGLDAVRPTASTAWPRVFLAGDWTATGWPATMEGAVRSGYLAAEALAGNRFLAGDLAARGLMKLF
jgi:squalene-associated FAD-dependent desaturase